MAEIRRKAFDQFIRFGENDPTESFIYERPAWQALGACAGIDPELFYPKRGESTREAKRVCSGCPVKQECLEFAVDNSEKFGIWGGLSERQRREIRKRRGQSR